MNDNNNIIIKKTSCYNCIFLIFFLTIYKYLQLNNSYYYFVLSKFSFLLTSSMKSFFPPSYDHCTFFFFFFKLYCFSLNCSFEIFPNSTTFSVVQCLKPSRVVPTVPPCFVLTAPLSLINLFTLCEAGLW